VCVCYFTMPQLQYPHEQALPRAGRASAAGAAAEAEAARGDASRAESGMRFSAVSLMRFPLCGFPMTKPIKSKNGSRLFRI